MRKTNVLAVTNPKPIVWEAAHAPGAGPARISMDLSEVRHALFLAEKIRIHRTPVNGGVVCMALAGDSEWSTDRVADRVEKYTSREVADWLRDVAIRGAAITIPDGALEPIATIQAKPVGRFDLGFDMDATRRERVLTGVRLGFRRLESRPAQWNERRWLVGIGRPAGSAG